MARIERTAIYEALAIRLITYAGWRASKCPLLWQCYGSNDDISSNCK